jgi:acetyl esterase/lipase
MRFTRIARVDWHVQRMPARSMKAIRTDWTSSPNTALVSVALLSGALLTGCDRREPTPTGQPMPTPAPNNAQPQVETQSGQIKGPTRGSPLPGQPAVETTAKDPLKAADSDMRRVLEAFTALGGKPLPTLSPEEARKQPTPADAVKSLLTKEGKSTAPIEVAKVDNRKIAGAAGQVDARIYTPKTDDKKPLPVIVYFHGGGFVIADLDAYDASARALAKGADAIVVSADYRRAPEHKFPAAHDDAFASYQWVTKNAASFGGDPKRIAVAGESAGGNLAANVSIMARDKGAPLPLHELLIYPMAQTTTNTPSYEQWANAKPLDRPSMIWFIDQTIRTPADKSDPRLDLVHAKLSGLPPTTIVLAEIDPLRSDGEMLARDLDAAGVKVEKKVYEGVTHEFFGMGAAVGDAKDAEEWASGRLKDALKR